MWKGYVPENLQDDFKKKFTEIILKDIDSLLDEAARLGTHHYIEDCDGECDEECLDDSDMQYIKDDALSNNKRLWHQVCQEMSISGKRIKQEEESEN